MTFWEKIKNFITSLEEREFYLYSAAFVGILGICMALLIYWHYSSVTNWKNQLMTLKKQRLETKNLLQNYEQFKQDQAAVSDILATDTTFKILEYYNDLINTLKLRSFQAKEPSEPITENLEEGAKEKTITTAFNNLTMKQVTDILAAIESNPRVYAKKLTMDKISKDRPKLNVTLDIATIESPSAETAS